ncbi:MAG: NUDIX domain-containing protein [archaeon]
MVRIGKAQKVKLQMWGHWKVPELVPARSPPHTAKIKRITASERKKAMADPATRKLHEKMKAGPLYRIAGVPKVVGRKVRIPIESPAFDIKTQKQVMGTDFFHHIYVRKQPEADRIGRTIPRGEKRKKYFARRFHEVPNAVSAIGLLLTADNKVVTIKRGKVLAEAGKHDSPAGYVFAGESPVEAIRRKLKGEMGLNLNEITFLGRGLRKARNQDNPPAMIGAHSRATHGAAHSVFVVRTNLTQQELMGRAGGVRDKEYVESLRFTNATPKGLEEIIKQNSQIGGDTIYTEWYRLLRREMTKKKKR